MMFDIQIGIDIKEWGLGFGFNFTEPSFGVAFGPFFIVIWLD